MKIKNELQKSLLKAAKLFFGIIILMVMVRSILGPENALFWMILFGVLAIIVLFVLLIEINKY